MQKASNEDLLRYDRDALLEALSKLRLEAIHYRNTGKGVQFLNKAIDQAEIAIENALATELEEPAS